MRSAETRVGVHGCRDAMAVFAMEAASIISERSLEISFASALSTVSASGVNINAGGFSPPHGRGVSPVLPHLCTPALLVWHVSRLGWPSPATAPFTLHRLHRVRYMLRCLCSACCCSVHAWCMLHTDLLLWGPVPKLKPDTRVKPGLVHCASCCLVPVQCTQQRGKHARALQQRGYTLHKFCLSRSSATTVGPALKAARAAMLYCCREAAVRKSRAGSTHVAPEGRSPLRQAP